MKRMRKLKSVCVIVFGGVLAAVPALQARTCGGNGDVQGSFGWIGTRTVTAAAPASAAATGTSTTTSTTTAPAPVTGSPTPIGALVAGAVNSSAFASIGRIFLDGNGGLFASSAAGGAVSSVGTYTLNGDCTVSATLTDTFTPATGGLVGITSVNTQPSTTFEGVMVQGGNEIDLTQTGSVSGTLLTLRKTKQNCSTADLFSAYGISASGYVAGATTTTTTNAGSTTTTSPNVPFSLLGRFVGDGNGTLYQDGIGASSPLTNREITGTYTINSDCTGTATLVTADGKKRGANFVIVLEGTTLNNAPEALELTFTDAGVVGSGFAQPQ